MTIQSAQKKSLTILAKQFGLDFIVAFGSQVSGRTHPGSDLDLGYTRAGEDLSSERRYALSQTLQEIFPDYEIDLVNLRLASPLLQHRAGFQSRLLVEHRRHSFALYQMSSYINYIDTRYLRTLQSQHLAKKYS